MHYCIFISGICNRESCSIWRSRCWMAVISMYYQFLSGIQLLGMGVVGMYLSKTYLETKHRPIYIEKESH